VEGAVYTWKGSAVFLAVEGVVLLLVIVTGRAARVFQGFFVAAAAAEVLWMSWPVYYERLNVQADVFADDTADALDMIAAQDDSFYRVDKQYFTVAHNDSFAQGYYGTSSYIGGMGIPENVLKFYTDLGLHDGINLRSIYAPSAYNQVDTLLGVKYALAQDYSGISNYGYEQIGETGSVRIFENTSAVPMGFVYYETISREEFEALSYYERQTALMEACLTDEDTGVESISQESIDRIKSIRALVDEYQIEFEYSTKSWSFEFEPNTGDEVLLVTIAFTDNAGETAMLKYRTEDGAEYGERITGLYCAEGNIFEITQAGVDSIWFDADAGAEGLKIAKVPKSVYYALWEENTARQQAGRVTLSETRSDYMRGTFTAEQDGILYLPIVNNGWQVCIDGVGQNIMTVNDAFIGVIVTAGTHELELSYPTGSLWSGYKKRVKIYGACLAVILFGSFYRGRFHKKRLRGSDSPKKETAA
jgi:uncharacterized membrane protein YfhO